MVILFMNPNTGSLSINYPLDTEMPLKELNDFAKRVVPVGVPYWIVTPRNIPEDRSFRDTWEVDESVLGKPTGYGEAK